MSAEAVLRVSLLAHAPLVALIGDRVAQNGVELGVGLPYVVFTAQHAPVMGLFDSTPLINQVTFSIENWATSAMEADAVANAVLAALAAHAPPNAAATLLARGSGFDGDLGLDATVLSVEWWE